MRFGQCNLGILSDATTLSITTLSIIAFSTMKLSIMTLSKMALSIVALNKMTLSILALSKMTLSIMILSIMTQHNNKKHSIYDSGHNATDRYAECRRAGGHNLYYYPGCC
jgi:hypothetical protein